MMSILPSRPFSRRLAVPALALSCLALASGCDKKYPLVAPPDDPSLDAQVRQAIGNWGVVPIGPMAAQDPKLVELGRALFFDKILSGNRDVSCSTCHSPEKSLTD